MEMIDCLVNNSKSALLSAIEIHNKPIFPHRYETVSILLINSWELIFKAFLLKNRPEIKIIRDDGTTKPFEDCLESVKSTIGKPFFTAAENVKKIYEYRCNCIHFYQDNIDVLLYSLFSKSVMSYSEFILTSFGIDLSEENNLILLPIGFKRPISPTLYLSNKSFSEKSSTSVKEFIKSIVASSNALIKDGVEDSVLVEYKISCINENRVSNADVIASITKDISKEPGALLIKSIMPDKLHITDDETAKRIKIDEESLFGKIYTETYDDICKKCKELFSDFLVNKRFWEILSNLKNIPTFHRKRLLDIGRPEGTGKDYYTSAIYDEFSKHYTKK